MDVACNSKQKGNEKKKKINVVKEKKKIPDIKGSMLSYNSPYGTVWVRRTWQICHPHVTTSFVLSSFFFPLCHIAISRRWFGGYEKTKIVYWKQKRKKKKLCDISFTVIDRQNKLKSRSRCFMYLGFSCCCHASSFWRSFFGRIIFWGF